jgi:L-cysteate sulfo-lyase
MCLYGGRIHNIASETLSRCEPHMNPSLSLALQRFPRVPLVGGPTPIRRLERVEHALGVNGHGVRIFVKRDDLMELGGGGNKLRKLEFHLGAARNTGVDTILTVGGLQSNHARLTAAVAARLGLACELFLAKVVSRADEDYERNGNVMLDRLFGARIHALPAHADALEAAQGKAAELRESGRNVLVIPTGGSTPLGSLGCAQCALEIAEQEIELGEHFSQIVVPNGSSGTHAGLAAGFTMLGRGAGLVRSFSVLADLPATARKTLELTRDTLTLLGHEPLPEADEINIDGTQRGDSYGIPTDAMIAAVRLLAEREGLLVDPVYSGKAFAGLLKDISSGRYAQGESVLFVMTGGTPGLYAYRTIFETT